MFATPDPSRSSPLARNLRLLQIEAGPHNARVFNRPVISRLVQGSPTSTPVIPYAVSGVTPARARFTVPLLFRQRRWRGSSPLARGLRGQFPAPTLDRGIIPARAGFTETSRIEVAWTYGSSPLARGLLELFLTVFGSARIIPARAGFTWTARTRRACRTDHPRSRGVYVDAAYAVISQSGSSPLARGLPISRPRRWICGSDHPRSRGVYAPRRRCALPGAGSSPLARGLPEIAKMGAYEARIIPARAGFTGALGSFRPLRSDHPRSRGVYSR